MAKPPQFKNRITKNPPGGINDMRQRDLARRQAQLDAATVEFRWENGREWKVLTLPSLFDDSRRLPASGDREEDPGGDVEAGWDEVLEMPDAIDGVAGFSGDD